MIKLRQYSTVAIAVAMTNSVFATEISIRTDTTDPVSIYDFSGIYFDGGKIRAANESSATRRIPVQIQQLPNTNAMYGSLRLVKFKLSFFRQYLSIVSK